MAGWLDAIKGIGTAAVDYVKDPKNLGDIASGVAGAVLGSGTSKGGGSQTNSISSVPAWMSDYAQQLLAQANQVASLPYQQYTGPRIAGLTQDQQDAANMVRDNTGQVGAVIQNAMGSIDPNAGQGMLTQAGQYMQNAGGSWLDNSSRFMDDYTSHVTNPAEAQAMRAWNERINPSIAADFSGSRGVGAYGSSAMLSHLAKAGTNLSTELGENMAQYLDRGYSSGMGQFNAENQQQGNLAGIAARLGQQEMDMNQSGANNMIDAARAWGSANANDISALNAVGMQQQGLNQGAMDIDYSNWLDSQNYSKEQIAYLQSILTGNAPVVDKTTTTNNSSTDYASPLQAALQGYSLYNAIKTGKAPPAPTSSNPSGTVIE